MKPKLNWLFKLVCSKYRGKLRIEVPTINTVCVLMEYFIRNYTLIIRLLDTIINQQKINF